MRLDHLDHIVRIASSKMYHSVREKNAPSLGLCLEDATTDLSVKPAYSKVLGGLSNLKGVRNGLWRIGWASISTVRLLNGFGEPLRVCTQAEMCAPFPAFGLSMNPQGLIIES